MAVTTPSAKLQDWNDDWLRTKGNYMTTITPELAAQLLERNVHNRKMKEAAITRYARAMAEDRWDGDASALSFDRHGDLMDGQNRLEACRRSGKAFPTLVRTGLRPESMRHIDIGIPRNVSDTFRLEKVKFATAASASISLRLRYEDAEAAGRKIGQPLDTKATRLDPDQAMTYLTEHPMHSSAGLAAWQLYKMSPRIKHPVWLAFLAMAGEKDEVGVKEFAERLLNGELGESPFSAVMRYLAKPVEARPGVRVRNRAERDLLALVKAWNAWRMEQPVATLQVVDADPVEPLV